MDKDIQAMKERTLEYAETIVLGIEGAEKAAEHLQEFSASGVRPNVEELKRNIAATVIAEAITNEWRIAMQEKQQEQQVAEGESVFKAIRTWSRARGLDMTDPIKQVAKLMEEVGELARAILRENMEEAQDAIGDCVVVLTILAQQHGWNIEDCIDVVYQVIKNRKGKTKNGVFVKDEDEK